MKTQQKTEKNLLAPTLQPINSLLVGRLSFKGNLLNYFLFLLGLYFLSALNVILGFTNNWLYQESLLVTFLAGAYAIILAPGIAYVSLRWFFLKTTAKITTPPLHVPPSPVNKHAAHQLSEVDEGKIYLKAGFSSFLLAYFFSFGVFIFTLGLGFPYYLYQQKAWFFNHSVIRFASGQHAHLRLTSQFKEYFFKSWAILLVSVSLLVGTPIFWLVSAIPNPLNLLDSYKLATSGNFLIFIVFMALLGVISTFYYLYWSIKWMLTHVTLTYQPPAPAPPPNKNLTTPTRLVDPRQFLAFNGNFLQFLVQSIIFVILVVFTLGIMLIFYTYWFGRYFINHTEIRALLVVERPHAK